MRLAARDGSEEARVAVLPFVPERRVVDACRVMGPEGGWYEEYARRIEQILAALVQDLHARDASTSCSATCSWTARGAARASASCTSARSTA